MEPSVRVSVDPTTGKAYVAYRALRSGERVAYTKQVSDAVNADFDVDFGVIGIELLRLDSETIAAAQRFTETLNLRFPSDLSGGGT